MLPDNKRQSKDVPFQGILRRLHWGVNTEEDVVTVNEATSLDSHFNNIVNNEEQQSIPENAKYPMTCTRRQQRD
jgi:hypothetical protein